MEPVADAGDRLEEPARAPEVSTGSGRNRLVIMATKPSPSTAANRCSGANTTAAANPTLASVPMAMSRRWPGMTMAISSRAVMATPSPQKAWKPQRGP